MIELKNVLVANPQNFTARLLLAEVSLGLGDQATAEKELTRASDAGAPESAVRPLHLRVLSARGQYTEMLASLGMETGGLSESQVLAFRGEAQWPCMIMGHLDLCGFLNPHLMSIVGVRIRSKG